MGFEFSHDFCVGEFLSPIGGDVLIFYDEEGVNSLDVRACAVVRGAKALAQEAEFIAVVLVPCVLEIGMA